MGIHANPLDGTDGRVRVIIKFLEASSHHISLFQTAKAQYMFQYFLKVVSTQFRTLNDNQVVRVFGL